MLVQVVHSRGGKKNHQGQCRENSAGNEAATSIVAGTTRALHGFTLRFLASPVLGPVDSDSELSGSPPNVEECLLLLQAGKAQQVKQHGTVA